MVRVQYPQRRLTTEFQRVMLSVPGCHPFFRRLPSHISSFVFTTPSNFLRKALSKIKVGRRWDGSSTSSDLCVNSSLRLNSHRLLSVFQPELAPKLKIRSWSTWLHQLHRRFQMRWRAQTMHHWRRWLPLSSKECVKFRSYRYSRMTSLCT